MKLRTLVAEQEPLLAEIAAAEKHLDEVRRRRGESVKACTALIRKISRVAAGRDDLSRLLGYSEYME